MSAYEQPIEASKLCLLDAMEALGPTAGARELFENAKTDERRQALHLMELFPSDEFLPILEKTFGAPDATLRSQARHALASQKGTQKWETTLLRPLELGDEEGRGQVIDTLGRRRSEGVRRALAARLQREPSAALRSKIETALRMTP